MPIREQQTTNKQHAIPQSIMSVEFKIIGDLTLKQFFFLMIFCGLAYLSFMTIQAVIFKWLFVIFFVGTGLAFAFLPLGDRGLDTWIVNFLRAMFLPNQFVYRKEENIPSVFLYQNLDVLKSELITLTPTSSRRKIEAYLEQQEAPVDKLDIDEKGFILKVKEAYSNASYWPTSGQGGGLGFGTDVNAGGSGGGLGMPIVTTTVIEDYDQENPAPGVQPQQSLTRLELPVGTTSSIDQADLKAPMPTTTLVEQKHQAEPSPQVVQPNQEPQMQKQPESQNSVPTQEPPVEIIKARASTQAYKLPAQPQVTNRYYSPTITPDMRAGRMFINLSQEASRGEIVLPIRGERTLKSTQEQEFEAGEKQKIDELDALINSVKSKELVQKQIISAQKLKEQEEARRRALEEETKKLAQSALAQDQQEKDALEKKRAEESAIREREAKAREDAFKEQARLEKLRQEEQALRQQKEDLLKKQREEEERLRKAQVLQQSEPRVQPQPIPLQPAQIDDAPSVPNIVWGMVTTSYQDSKVGVPGVVVVIRNQKGEVVRAVKTSTQGKFAITTPLINGSYTIEVDKENKSGLKFAITAVDARGELIPTLEIAGKA